MTVSAPEISPPEPRPSSLGRSTIFGIVCGAHFINHFQSAMLGVIYPLMMKELGLGFAAIASIAFTATTFCRTLLLD